MKSVTSPIRSPIDFAPSCLIHLFYFICCTFSHSPLGGLLASNFTEKAPCSSLTSSTTIPSAFQPLVNQPSIGSIKLPSHQVLRLSSGHCKIHAWWTNFKLVFHQLTMNGYVLIKISSELQTLFKCIDSLWTPWASDLQAREGLQVNTV